MVIGLDQCQVCYNIRRQNILARATNWLLTFCFVWWFFPFYSLSPTLLFSCIIVRPKRYPCLSYLLSTICHLSGIVTPFEPRLPTTSQGKPVTVTSRWSLSRWLQEDPYQGDFKVTTSKVISRFPVTRRLQVDPPKVTSTWRLPRWLQSEPYQGAFKVTPNKVTWR